MRPEARVVIFDMDGTLTKPGLDFDGIREEIGLDVPGPILEAMRQMSPEDRARSNAILERHESVAAANSVLQPGAAEVVAAVRSGGLAAVLMTRNSRKSAQAFQSRHGIQFDLIRTREDGAIKPSPEPILEICDSLGTTPRHAWTIGDYYYDIVCGARAGAETVLFLDADARRPSWADEADHVINALTDLILLMGMGASREQGESHNALG